MSSGVPPYLGSKISIISKSEIRYEGVLYTVDTKDATVALAKVRSFGTEGRPTDRPIAPRDEVYEYIIFRASDIKDLHVCEPPKSHYSVPHDPAIVQQSGPVSHYSSNQLYNTLYGLSSLQNFTPQVSGYPCMPPVLTAASNRHASQPSQRKHTTSDAGVQVSVKSAEEFSSRVRGREPLKQRSPNRMNYQQRRASLNRQQQQQNIRRGVPRRGRRRRSEGSPIDKFEHEYDFEQANAEFQELENKLSKNSIDDVEQSPLAEDLSFGYDKKKSFFDDISCEASQRSKGLPRFDWRYERKLNVETFGASANNVWLRRRRARGNFRRGYRGRNTSYTRMNETVKTVTFDETPSVKEVEIIKPEKSDQQLPVIEVVLDKEKDWPEPSTKPDSVWN